MLPPLLNKIAALVKRRPRVERRGSKRLTPTALTPCQLRIAGEEEQYPAFIHDLSKNGVGILTAFEIEADTMIEIVIINTAHTFALSGEVKVVRCTRVVSGSFLLGGEFTNALQHDAIVPFVI